MAKKKKPRKKKGPGPGDQRKQNHVDGPKNKQGDGFQNEGFQKGGGKGSKVPRSQNGFGNTVHRNDRRGG